MTLNVVCHTSRSLGYIYMVTFQSTVRDVRHIQAWMIDIIFFLSELVYR